jgi:hypothetical protein
VAFSFGFDDAANLPSSRDRIPLRRSYVESDMPCKYLAIFQELVIKILAGYFFRRRRIKYFPAIHDGEQLNTKSETNAATLGDQKNRKALIGAFLGLVDLCTSFHGETCRIHE